MQLVDAMLKASEFVPSIVVGEMCHCRQNKLRDFDFWWTLPIHHSFLDWRYTAQFLSPAAMHDEIRYIERKWSGTSCLSSYLVKWRPPLDIDLSTLIAFMLCHSQQPSCARCTAGRSFGSRAFLRVQSKFHCGRQSHQSRSSPPQNRCTVHNVGYHTASVSMLGWVVTMLVRKQYV